ncbi:uncharacterized protein LOC117495806 isoform X2 [Trematomus bernacchii]|uniref:uncharacterized protein LOC117495806 isoform X2 n=1 Tax=Trematomus bernacchii TaxID=40690 RepID=UPI00146CE283|nr:uncharacterized protein LOC117495806 isoform X2 [Trematomus bernacchii]
MKTSGSVQSMLWMRHTTQLLSTHHFHFRDIMLCIATSSVVSLFQKFPQLRPLVYKTSQYAEVDLITTIAATLLYALSADNMNFKVTNPTFRLFAVAFSALAVMLAAAADASPELTCNVTKTPDGFLHLLSRSSDCNTSWVDKNGVVLARNQVYDKNKVQSLTDQSLTSKLCHDNIDYTSTCGSNSDSSKDNRLTDERAHCTYTCSSPIWDPKASQPTPG